MADPFLDILEKVWVTPPADEDEYEEEQKDSRVITLEDEERMEKIRKLKIENAVKVGSLIEKTLVRAILEEVGHNIQTLFVDLPRRESPTIAAIVEKPDKERDIEKYLSDKIQDAIVSMQTNIEKLASSGTFE